jgi:allantoinase
MLIDLPTVDMVLKNGRIITPAGRIDASIVIDKGKIALIASESHLPPADSSINLDGQYVLPGIFDAHVHFRDPNDAYLETEDFASGTKAAAAGGVSTVLDMPNTCPPVISASALKDKLQKIEPKAYVNFGLYGGAGIQNLEELSSLASAGVVAFKTFVPAGRANSASDEVSLFRVFEKIASIGLPCSVHAENSSLIDFLKKRLVADNRNDLLAHTESRPNFVEAQAISNVLILANAAKARVHIAHMSTWEGVRLVALAKAMGHNTTAETCPQYLLLTVDKIERHSFYAKVNPPLRSKSDVRELWKAVKDRVIDILVSDHAPQPEGDKDSGLNDIWKASSGMPGVETMLPLMLTKVNEGLISLERLVEVLSESVSKIFGLYPRKGIIRVGSDADLTIVDMHRERTIRVDDLKTKAKDLVIYDGWKVRGVPVGTIVGGKIVMWDGEVVGRPGMGEFIFPDRSN